MTAVLSKPSDVSAPIREAGGDNEVPRDKKGRPRIRMACDNCTAGKIPSPKTGKPIQCPKCKGKGEVERSFTRTTTYIDVLDDKSNIEAWQMRMVLVGVERDRALLNDVGQLYDAQLEAEKRLKHLPPTASSEERDEAKAAVKEPKDELNRKAQIAKKTAGAEDKADKGTELHGLSELVDQKLPLPKGISFGDVIDMDAYRRATEWLKIVHMEKLVVCDVLKVAGTPDRVSTIDSEFITKLLEEGYDGELFKIEDGKIYLATPDGSLIGDDVLMITDLKTGTVEYGALKMAMQLAIYANSELYDYTEGIPFEQTRTPLGNISKKWGLIMNAPAGMGECKLYWADLELGWKAVEIAGLVRNMRGVGGQGALLPVAV